MNKKGMTLVEVIVVIAIIGIISTVIANIFIFGNRNFKRSDTRSSSQMDVRLAAQVINKELRYATDIKLLKEFNNDNEDEFNYIYFDESSKRLMQKKDKENAQELLKGNQSFNNIEFWVEANLLKFSIDSQSTSNGTNYNIESAVSLLNGKSMENVQRDKKNKVIKYKK